MSILTSPAERLFSKSESSLNSVRYGAGKKNIQSIGLISAISQFIVTDSWQTPFDIGFDGDMFMLHNDSWGSFKINGTYGTDLSHLIDNMRSINTQD